MENTCKIWHVKYKATWKKNKTCIVSDGFEYGTMKTDDIDEKAARKTVMNYFKTYNPNSKIKILSVEYIRDVTEFEKMYGL